MNNYVGYLRARLEPRSRFEVASDLVPYGFADELSVGHPVGIWWIQPLNDQTKFRIIGRTVIERMDVTRYGDIEHLVMYPDLALSFDCSSNLGKPVILNLREFDLSSSRLCKISSDEHKLVAHAVMAVSPVRLGKALVSKPTTIVASPERVLLKDARALFQHALRKPVNDPAYYDKQDTRGIISGVGLHVLSALKEAGHMETSAFAAVLELDPVIAGAGPMVIKNTVIESPIDIGEFPLIEYTEANEDVEDTDYTLITPGSLNARKFSTPLGTVDSTPATQRAENVHQEILRKIEAVILKHTDYECRDNGFADLVLSRPGCLRPSHVMEIKSITSDNLEAQLAKGIIQLGRRQYAHRGEPISYHLVVEKTDQRVPSYLLSIINRMDIHLHLFNNSLDGIETCHSLYLKIKS